MFTTLVGDSPRYSPTKRGCAEPSTDVRTNLSFWISVKNPDTIDKQSVEDRFGMLSGPSP